ncbi:MAG: sigma-54 dependent transcriptional regulator [Endomicrobia bacterium]|nr:sigma-54 dependent transcriptional regulator [Endomicrobiia bacterium]
MIVLIIDDDKVLCEVLSNILEEAGHSCITSNTLEDAIRNIKENSPDIIFLDLNLPDKKGLEVLRAIKNSCEELPVIIITGYATIENAVEAMKAGAFDYLIKPLDKNKIILTLQKAVNVYKMKSELNMLRSRMLDSSNEEFFIGKDKKVIELISIIKKVAPTNLTVLLQGESGVGKGEIAKLIHKYSNRKEGPYIVVDCGTIPDTLIESELFGYEKGAFTGADKRKKGMFELADNGSIFLDEVSNLPYSAQAKLLRVLQEKEIQPLGSQKPMKVDVRVVVASNTPLEEKVKNGAFREDLFHRLNEFMIYVPPLRDRGEDIFILVDYFIKEANKEFNKNVKSISFSVRELFKLYSWPGNIRELRNVIRRAVLLADDIIYPEHLAQSIQLVSFSTSASNKLLQDDKIKDNLGVNKEELEIKQIRDALISCRFNKKKAAKMLGITRQTLYYKMKKYKIE